MQKAALLALFVPALFAGDLRPETDQAFDRYVRTTEQSLTSRKEFLWCEQDATRLARAKKGEAVVMPTGAKPDIKVDGGLIHDWVGCVFIPGATLAGTLAMVQDYDRHKDVYQPEVIGSKLLSHKGDDFHIFLRLLKKKVITVVLNTEHDVHYTHVDAQRAHSRSVSTKIAEVDDAGKPGEKEKEPGRGHGFMWRLNSYWRFAEQDGGVYLECQAVSLSRDVPTGLGWMIEPIIRNLPRESLANTLTATRRVLAKP